MKDHVPAQIYLFDYRGPLCPDRPFAGGCRRRHHNRLRADTDRARPKPNGLCSRDRPTATREALNSTAQDS